MEARIEVPPVIEPRPRRLSGPVTFFSLVLAAIAVAVVVRRLGIAFPKCSLKALTGIPCAFCGGTRSLEAMGYLQFAEAFWWNPLVALGVFAATISAAFWMIAPGRVEGWIVRAKKWPLMCIGIAVVIVNWMWVVKYLPR